MNDIGHNANARLQSIIDRIERLNEERKALGNDISDIFREAKSAGYDVKALRELLRQRKMDERERQEREDLIATYRAALGI